MKRHERHWQRGEAEVLVAQELEKLNGNPVGWTLAARFYAALHLTTAYLRTRYSGFDPKRHEERAKLIRETKELSEGKNRRFHLAYRRLKDVSEQFRYEPGYIINAADLESTKKDLSCVSGHLTKLMARQSLSH